MEVGEEGYTISLTVSHVNLGCQKVEYTKWVECSAKITAFFENIA